MSANAATFNKSTSTNTTANNATNQTSTENHLITSKSVCSKTPKFITSTKKQKAFDAVGAASKQNAQVPGGSMAKQVQNASTKSQSVYLTTMKPVNYERKNESGTKDSTTNQ